MRKPKMIGVVCAAMLVAALATLGLAGSASAKLVGEYEKFKKCPFTNAEAKRCIVSVTESGEVVLGSKKVPIEKPVTLQGGFTAPSETEGVSKFIAPTSGEALSKAPQNVPGGLLGIVPEEKQPWLVKKLIKFFFENSLTGVNSTLELAKPASEIRISELNLARKEGVALKMPVKVHLENPFLGKNCFVGSSSSPITFELTTGVTSPPKPNEPIEGSAGHFEFREGGRILHITENKLVDNAWSAPAATGCGGLLSFLVTPIINGQLGSTTAGHNTAILNSTVDIASTSAVKKNNEEHP
jgi:hypothetical protein